MGNWKREEVPDHKFSFVNVHDFAKNDFFSRVKYMGVFLMVLKSVLVYLADIYNAGGLILIDKWMGGVKPRVISFDISKWIFVGSIGISFLLLFIEVRKAKRIIASDDISFAFTNVVAKRYFALTSYDHWCFFEEISDQQKFIDKVAFFVFFSFKGWKRLIFCDGPRQIINALTLYSFFKERGFSLNISKYGKLTTVASLGVMIFTVTVFAVSICLLAFAFLLYLPLLCKIRGNLKEFCCRIIDKRIEKILKNQTKRRVEKELKNPKALHGKKPTIPVLDHNAPPPPSQLMQNNYGMKQPTDPHLMGVPRNQAHQAMYDYGGADGYNAPHMGRNGSDPSQGIPTSPVYGYNTPGGQPIEYPTRPESNNSNSAYSDTSTLYSAAQGRPYKHPSQNKHQYPPQKQPQYPPQNQLQNQSQYPPQNLPQHPPQHAPYPYQQMPPGGDPYEADYIVDEYQQNSKPNPYNYQNGPPENQYYGENYHNEYNDNNYPPPQNSQFIPPELQTSNAIPPISPTRYQRNQNYPPPQNSQFVPPELQTSNAIPPISPTRYQPNQNRPYHNYQAQGGSKGY